MSMNSPKGAQKTTNYFKAETTETCLLNCCKMSTSTASGKAKKSAGPVTNPEKEFILSEVTASAEIGCRGCKLSTAMITGMFAAYNYTELDPAECVPAGENKLGEVKSGFIRLKAYLGTTFWHMRCRGCATPTKRTKTRGKLRSDCALYTIQPDGPPNEVWTRCAFSQPALHFMGARLSFHADAFVEPSKYGFFGCTGRGSCPCG
ncbi:hypothetical protein BJX99DRAFT_261040 [Aspergillus californicus]